PLSGPDLHGRYLAVLGPFDGAVSVTALDWVIRYQDGTWSSPDQHLSVSASQGAAPSVELVRPEGGAQVSGEILLVAAAADDGGEPRVTFLADGVVLGELTSRPYEFLLDTSSLVAGAHTLTARAEDGQNNQAESSVAVSVGGSGPAECRVVGPGPDGSVGPLPDGGVGPGADGGSGPADEGGAGCGCVGAPGDAGDGTEYTAAMIFVLSLLAILGLRSSRRHLPRPFRSRGRQEARPRELLGLGLAVGLGAVLVAACGPSGGDPKDASPHDASFQGDGGNPTGDASLLDSGTDPDASTECTEDATGRTGTTIYLYDSLGQESGDPITVGTVVTVVVEIEISVAPEGNIGFLQLETKNLSVDRTSFTLGGGPLEVSDPFDGVIPLTLTLGVHEVSFEAAVQSNVATLEVDAALGHGDGGRCPMARSHSLAVLQVLGGVQKAVDCYDLDDARSVQVSPHVPLDSTSQYLAENGLRADVLIDNLVVGGPQCPGPGVLVHQISKCFYRQAGSTVTLSGAAYGGEGWFVDDLLLVEILDAGEDVVAAFTTFQIGTQNLNCCQSPPCTSSLTYDSGGVAIQNLVQGGGNNGAIAAGAFDLTPHLPAGSGPFFLRFTALDQGVEGALDRVFLNIGFP
ncbi:MAG: Ig-like domain-containing protein, partial [Polyangia bacterium]|nr:Ig-like domain-containing protein [Polyangia bacterium]